MIQLIKIHFFLVVVTDPLGDVLKFIQDYNAKYPNHPVFYQGTYAQALNDAKRELKFLLIYLHSETSSPQIHSGQQRITETVNFCRNALSNREVIDYVNRNMLFWACDITSPEGYRVSHSMNARSHPLMVIIALRDNKMTVMGRLEGDCTAEELLARMTRVVNDNERWLNAARHERLERSLTQTLRAQQDVAYEESLKADQEKERKRQMERDEQAKVEREIQEERDAEERRLDLKERLRMELVQSVPSEPSEDQVSAISIVFKLPNGMRVTRRFLKTDSLNVST
jgi:FAS-associated factor 2